MVEATGWNGAAIGEAIIWTKTEGSRKVFFTTLGHPDDFKNDDFRRLTINGLLWALNLPLPKTGTNAAFPETYNPPPSGVLK